MFVFRCIPPISTMANRLELKLGPLCQKLVNSSNCEFTKIYNKNFKMEHEYHHSNMTKQFVSRCIPSILTMANQLEPILGLLWQYLVNSNDCKFAKIHDKNFKMEGEYHHSNMAKQIVSRCVPPISTMVNWLEPILGLPH